MPMTELYLILFFNMVWMGLAGPVKFRTKVVLLNIHLDFPAFFEHLRAIFW